MRIIKRLFLSRYLGKLDVDFNSVDVLPPHSELFCPMINLRRIFDSRLNRTGSAGNWPVGLFRTTPEAVIVEITEIYRRLQRISGCSGPQIIEKLEAYRSELGEGVLPDSLELGPYIKYRLQIEDPQFLELDPRILLADTNYASRFMDEFIIREQRAKPYPPIDWLQSKLTIDGVEKKGAVGPTRVLKQGGTLTLISPPFPRSEDRKWKLIKVLMTDQDEVWHYSRPAVSWTTLAGEWGIALVRHGRPIYHVVTMRS